MASLRAAAVQPRAPRRATALARLAVFVAATATFGLWSSVLIHEAVGHGLTAWAVGGTFDGFSAGWGGDGVAFAFAPPGAPPWKDLAVRAGGVVVVLLGGIACFIGARRARPGSVRGLALVITGAVWSMSTIESVFWCAWTNDLPSDTMQVLSIVAGDDPAVVESARIAVSVVAGAIGVVVQWACLRSFIRRVEASFGGDPGLSAPRAAVVLLTMYGLPAVAGAYVADFVHGGGVGISAAGHAAALISVGIGLMTWWRRAVPHPVPVNLRWRDVIFAAVAVVAVAIAIHAWFRDGVRWSRSSAAASATEASAPSFDELLAEAREVKKSGVPGLAARLRRLGDSPTDDARFLCLLSVLGPDDA